MDDYDYASAWSSLSLGHLVRPVALRDLGKYSHINFFMSPVYTSDDWLASIHK